MPSIAIVPLRDGDGDERSRDTALAVGEALAAATSLRVVGGKAIEEVLAYHQSGGGEDPGLSEADAELRRAKERYFQFRSDEALAAADRAVALLAARPEDLSKSGPALVDASLTQAVIARSRGDLTAARRALARALKIHPSLDLASQEYPPGLVALFEEESGALAAVPRGTVSVSTKPPAAEVFLNGMSAGVTPLEFQVPEGDYRLLIRTNRYGDVERAISVSDGARVEVREKLRWVTGAAASPAATEAAEVREALRIADLLKADKVVLINVDGDAGRIEARMVDRMLRVGQPPMSVRTKGGAPEAEALAELTRAIASQAASDIAADPARAIDPKGVADPALLGKRKKPLFKSPLFWGIVGALVAGGVGGGIAAAMSGGGGDRGSVRVEFR